MTAAFRTIPADGRPLKVVLVGAGNMGRAWLAAMAGCPEVELDGVVDIDIDAASALARSMPQSVSRRAQITVGTDSVEVAARSGGQAIVDATIPAAHHPVTTAALFAGLPVLGEKPAAATVAQGLSLIAAAEVTGELFMISQSRRYNEHLFRFREQMGGLGRIGVLTTQFFRAPRFGGFRDDMDHPLLLDMAIHPLDASRFLLEADPVAVYCEEYNPVWSWYRGDAGCTAIFEMSSGARYVFTGSWCSPGLETSWNGSWRVSGEKGTAIWNGDDEPQVEQVGGSIGSAVASAELPGEGIAGSLREFVHALRTGDLPMGEVHSNISSLAMVEAAIESAATGTRVRMDAVMAAALGTAMANETRTDVALQLKAWHAEGRY